MLEKYIKYDIEGLIRDYRDNYITMRNLEMQLQSIDGFGKNQDGERVQSSPCGDGMDKIILRREQLKRRIEEYNNTLELYDKAWEQLNEQEKFVLQEFFQKNQSQLMACEVIRQKYFVEKTRAYDFRREALSHLRRLVFGI